MKLERITLENFRQYAGRQHLKFSTDAHKRVTVIHGVNGAGKSSLFMAINWCLYGEGVNNVGELISKDAINRADVGNVVRASVEVSFTHGGERFLVKRILEGVKSQNNRIEIDDKPQNFTMMRMGADGQAETVKNPIGVMNAILSANVRTYFLFDGEKIDNFAKPEAAAEVREAIYRVLKFEMLERGQRHLESIAQDYRKELKNSAGEELRALISKDEEKREAREKAEQDKARLESEIASARNKISTIDQRLREIQNAKDLQQQRDRVETTLKQRQQELKEITDRIRDLATGGYYIIARPAIDRALRMLDEKRERGEIPSNIRQQFVQDLIDQMKCICGRPITKDSPEHQRLVNLLNSSVPGSLEDDVWDTSADLRAFHDRIQTRLEEIDSSMRHRSRLEDAIKGSDAELDDIRRQLRESELEEISSLEKQRETFQTDIESNNLNIGSLQERITVLSKEIAQLEDKITRAKKVEKREQFLSRKLELAQKAADAIEEIYHTYADDQRQKIEVKTKEIFKKLIWKDSHFQDIKLDSNYNLEVIDRYGLPARPELSAGERQVLSLSFITAMSRISEEEAPLVMDTPFGRLSSHHRNNITEHLPDLADQLVLFVTDEELRDQSRENIEPRIGVEYRLEFDRTSSCTKIVEVG